MGNWNVTVRGIGPHHNGAAPYDANELAKEFVQKLREAGHEVASATFTFGGEENLMPHDPAVKHVTSDDLKIETLKKVKI